MIPDDELLKLACEFNLGPIPIVNGRPYWWMKYPREISSYRVTVKNMGNPNDGPDRWGIIDSSNYCLNKLGEWEYQSLPSGRADDFYSRCRYDSVHEAINYFRQWNEAVLKFADEKIEKTEGNVIINWEEIPIDNLKFSKE